MKIDLHDLIMPGILLPYTELEHRQQFQYHSLA